MLNELPSEFTRHIADRLGCGIAIILRGMYLQFSSPDEWTLVNSLLDVAATYQMGRGFVFDGIASCVENSIPNISEFGAIFNSGVDEELLMSTQCASILAKLLCKFASGTYENDLSYSLPAMFCLEKVYYYLCYRVATFSNEEEKKVEGYVPDQKLWNSVLEAIFHVSCSSDANIAQKGVESLHHFLLTTKIESIPSKSWLGALDLLSSKQPDVTFEILRMKSFGLLVRMILIHVPYLCRDEENLDQLTQVINRTAALIAENLGASRQGKVSTLFESTVQQVTNLSNVMLMPEFASEQNFSQWAGNVLFEELEKVGAGGASARMITATTAKEINDLNK